MKHGLALPQAAGFTVGRDVARTARAAEAAGYSSVWVYERVLFPQHPADGMNGVPGLPWIDFYRYCDDALTVLTLAAAVTERVRLGTSVLVAPLHHPLSLARALATVDRVSGGRVVAGFGSGWSSDEYRAVGADFGRRGRALEETVDACRRFWGADPVSYQDSRLAVEDALINPKPVGVLPILLGGGRSERALDRIARKADGWIPTGLSVAAMGTTWQHIKELADKEGRDPQTLQLVPRAGVMLMDRPAPAGRRPFQGSWEQVLTDAAAVAELGADELIFDLFPSVRDGDELIDRSAELRERLVDADL